jgi:hypothetical protein
MSKRAVMVAVINDNQDKPYETVVQMIADAVSIPMTNARGAYRFLVKNGLANGSLESIPARTKKPKTVTMASIHKKVAQKYREKAAAAKPPVDPEIKARNLAKLRMAGESFVKRPKEVVQLREQVKDMYREIDERKELQEELRANIPSSLHRDLGLV